MRTLSKRNRYDIMAIILKLSEHRARISHLVYKANTNFLEIKTHLKNLINARLLSKFGSFYQTTDKGVEYLQKYIDLTDLLE